MRFPVVIHTDNHVDFGIFLPDIPGVFSGGHSIEECLANVQEAVEMVCEAKGMKELPEPSPLAEVLASDGAKDGWVMMADIDTGFLNNRVVRISLSVPEYLLPRIDKRAHQAGMTRSAYMVHAALA